MENCLFCKIIAGDIPSERVYEDENMLIIRDIDPKAPNHYLCLPKEHFGLLSEMSDRQAAMLGSCLKKISELKELLHLAGGYRLVVNQGEDAGQSVMHVHVHILSGKKMGWTPA